MYVVFFLITDLKTGRVNLHIYLQEERYWKFFYVTNSPIFFPKLCAVCSYHSFSCQHSYTSKHFDLRRADGYQMSVSTSYTRRGELNGFWHVQKRYNAEGSLFSSNYILFLTSFFPSISKWDFTYVNSIKRQGDLGVLLLRYIDT